VAKTILLVDDDPDILESLGTLVQLDLGFRTVTASSGQAGLQILAHRNVDAVVSDFRMPGMNGCAFIRRARAMHPHLPAILISAFQDAAVEDECRALGVDGMLKKPVDPAEFEALLEKATAGP
jgi:CheY-like chemotaxis protein